MCASTRGAIGEIPPFLCISSNVDSLATGQRTVSVGQFDWGGLLLKSNGGAQRYPQPGRQSGSERKGRRAPDRESDGTSGDESRA